MFWWFFDSPNMRSIVTIHYLGNSFKLFNDSIMTYISEITNVMEYEALAKQKLAKMVYDYYASGAEDQWTLQENRNAFSRIL